MWSNVSALLRLNFSSQLTPPHSDPPSKALWFFNRLRRYISSVLTYLLTYLLCQPVSVTQVSRWLRHSETETVCRKEPDSIPGPVAKFRVLIPGSPAWVLISRTGKRGFDGVVHNLWPMANIELRGSLITLRASCGTVYCNRSCLFVCVCVCVCVCQSVTTITWNSVHRSNWVCT